MVHTSYLDRETHIFHISSFFNLYQKLTQALECPFQVLTLLDSRPTIMINSPQTTSTSETKNPTPSLVIQNRLFVYFLNVRQLQKQLTVCDMVLYPICLSSNIQIRIDNGQENFLKPPLLTKIDLVRCRSFSKILNLNMFKA